MIKFLDMDRREFLISMLATTALAPVFLTKNKQLMATGQPAAATIDITFFITSDTHYGVGDDEAIPANRKTIDMMNMMPGTPYPVSVGGTVDTPRGVVVTGDLTEDALAEEWGWFTADYGVNGEGRINYPVYEGWGNHDYHDSRTTVLDGIALRNKTRPGLANVSSNGFHYSWDWDRVHFIQLNDYPGTDEGDPDSWGTPKDSLLFLKRDLSAAIKNSNRPVVIFFHRALDGWGLTNWSKDEQEAFLQVITPYKDNVIAIFGGHGHVALQGTWNGIQYYEASATQPNTDDNGFTVVKITNEKIVVTTRHSVDETWGSIFEKTLTLSGIGIYEGQQENQN